jgi:hypothetical protein
MFAPSSVEPQLSLKVKLIPNEHILRKRDEIMGRKGEAEKGPGRQAPQKGAPDKQPGEYTLGEIQELFGSSGIDLVITRTPDGVKIGMSKESGEEE